MLNNKVRIKKLTIANNNNLKIYMLMLNQLHEQVSGNKFFKLFKNLEHAKQLGKTNLISMGGAYSNHLVALAYAANYYGFKATAFVRGEQVNSSNAILNLCKKYNLDIIFVNRESYKELREQGYKERTNEYFIPEGGANILGVDGASFISQYNVVETNNELFAQYNFDDILKKIEPSHYNFFDYDVIVNACGTATTMKGLLKVANKNQHVLGIQVLKGVDYLKKEILNDKMLDNITCSWDILDVYHFGGYAKNNTALTAFIAQKSKEHIIPLEHVYTGKMMYALYDLIQKKYFKINTKILIIHTGGVYS